MLLNLEVNITAGSLTSCPGRCSCGRRWCTSSCALSIAGGDVLSTRSTGIVFFWWWWWCSCCQAAMIGDGVYCCAASVVLVPARRRLAASALVQHCCHGRSGSFQRCYGCYDSSASAEALRLVAPCACLLTCLAWQLPTFCMLVSNTASSAFCVGLSFVSSYLFPEGITTI